MGALPRTTMPDLWSIRVDVVLERRAELRKRLDDMNRNTPRSDAKQEHRAAWLEGHRDLVERLAVVEGTCADLLAELFAR